MWKGAKVAYFFIAMCLFPIAIGDFWTYKNQISTFDSFEAGYTSRKNCPYE